MKRIVRLSQKNLQQQMIARSLKNKSRLQSRFMTSQYFSVEDFERAGSLKEKVTSLVRAYQVTGHVISKLDPLDLNNRDLSKDPSLAKLYPALDIKNYNFTEADYDKEIQLGLPMMKGFLDPNNPTTTLRKLLPRIQETYCGPIGVEYMHLSHKDEVNWLREKVETPQKFNFSAEEKRVNLERLLMADMFERFCAQKFVGTKRFGIEGAESVIPGVKSLIGALCDNGVESIVMGMPHRGRLNILAQVLRKPLELIFSEFAQTNVASGDVKYHLGVSLTRRIRSGKTVRLSLVPNPSHLETVDPVVQGKTRGKQFLQGDDRSKTMSILFHGDAAFAGQGVVYETTGFTDLHGYTTGGTIHIVINNQIGFTTNPYQSRSTDYCTDVAKFIGAPVFHVNGDDVEAVVHTMKLAAEFRQKFKKDVMLDIVCYRKHGHNEMDQPMFTQPIMYTKIANHKSTLDIYAQKCLAEGAVTQEQYSEMQTKLRKILEDAFQRSKQNEAWDSGVYVGENWGNLPKGSYKDRPTGISEDRFKAIGKALYTIPEGFMIHNTLKKELAGKKDMIEKGQGIDWATGEALAFGTLLDEGHHVRLSGQDVERGTFSHRHAVLVDQSPQEIRYTPLNNIAPKQAPFQAHNSHLSEYAVLGFEYGYAMENPNMLTLWEGQFGDFANGAQIIVDQFISSAEQKWGRPNGLVMLLPHGYEGQGPEHSNARLERYLQLSNEEPDVYPRDISRHHYDTNYQVVNCSTPANYFHVLRRQLYRDFRKPLIIMTPKSLLRFKHCVSTFEDIKEGTHFLPVIPDTVQLDEAKVKRVLFCTGKIYYDLMLYREKHNISNVAIVRVEELTPFPFALVGEQAKKYKHAEAVWVQEEPENYGAWTHFYFRAITAFNHHGRKNLVPSVVARKASSSPATGNTKVHNEEQAAIVEAAFKL